MDYKKQALNLHKKYKGKIETRIKVPLKDKKDLSLVYTPGVAEVSRAIARQRRLSFSLTNRGNTVAIISDGSAVLGLGNIGPEAALPVMEGKAVLFKKFAGLDAVPLCLATQDTKEIIKTIKFIAPNFAAVNLEDISAPRCFEIEEALQDLGIPVMHDDQHGTAIVVLAGLFNALKVVRKDFSQIKIVISGAGAAGQGIFRLLKNFTSQIIVLDSQGAICSERKIKDKYKITILQETGNKKCGLLKEVLKGADVFIGVSAPLILKKEWIKLMASRPIVFALANPVPEIMPQDAWGGGAAVVATGRSDFPNQINNALAFPGVFKGAIEGGARQITLAMKIAAAQAIARLVKKPPPQKIVPSILNKKVHEEVVRAVQKAI